MILTHNVPGISISFTHELNGSGDILNKELVEVIQTLYPNRVFNNCLEWCSGPGFLGFAVLGNQLCNTLHLSDIYEPAKEIVNKTIQDNNLEDCVKFYVSDNFKSIPTGTKFDLIIANPPHFNCDPYAPLLTDQRRYKDTDWATHHDFFNNVKPFLADDGKILLVENIWGSGVTTFEKMIADNNLKISNHLLSKRFQYDIWYLEVSHM
jgi:tRNA1(Val) A37 N6-methylase TrmN6